MNKKVLIVCFTFPPHSGIGGRRWAKFAKYLHRQGVEVVVLTAKRRRSQKQSLWTDDIKDLNKENIYTYRHFYPEVLQQTNLTFFEKVRYKVAYFFVKLLSKGNPFDRTVFDKKAFLSQLDTIIRRHGIKNVIATGAPFNLLYYSSLYKQQNPQINLITDLRDPWTWGAGYGFSLLSQEKTKKEKQKETTVLSIADHVFVPVNTMKEKLQELYPLYQNKIESLPHCFDSEETAIPTPDYQGKNTIRFIYGGTLYDNALIMLEHLALAFQNHIKTEVLYDLYVLNKQEEMTRLQSAFNSFLRFKDAVAPTELFKQIKDSDYYVAIFPDEYKDFISTKFYEIISLRVPIIIISNQGLLSEFIVNNRLGYHVLPTQIKTKVKEIVEGKKTLSYNYDFDLSQYTFEYQAQRLKTLLFA